MIRSANRDDCLEFDAVAFAQEAERISAGGHFLPNEVHQIVKRQSSGPCGPTDVGRFAPFAMLAFLVAATSGSVNLLNAVNSANSKRRRRRKRRDLLDRTARRIGDLGGLEHVLNSIDILGILPRKGADQTRTLTLPQPLVGGHIMRRQGHQQHQQQQQQPRQRNQHKQEQNIYGPPPPQSKKYAKKWPPKKKKKKKKTLKENIVDSVRGFRLAEGLPSIGDIHDLSQNVTDDVRRRLGNIADKLRVPTLVVADRRQDPGGGGWGPSSRPPQEAAKAEPLVQAFNRVTNKFQEFRLLPGLPSIKEISRISDSVNKKLRKRIKGIPRGLNDMGHKITQASRNVHGNIRRRYQGIRKTLLHPIRPGEKTSSLQPQIEREESLVEVFDRVATKFNRFRLLPVLPSVGELSQMSGNVTENIRHKIRDLPQELNALPSLFQNITEKLNTLPFLYAVTRNVSDTLDQVSHNLTKSLRREIWPNERSDDADLDGESLAPDLLQLALRFLDPLDLTSGSAIENIDRVQAKVAETIASAEQIFTNTSVADLGQLKAYLTAAPKLIPLVLEANLPDEDLFKKFLVGTRFTQDELYTLHSSVLELERFLQMTKKGVDVEKAPTVLAMAEALSERNLGLMGAILALMIRAEAEPLYRVDGGSGDEEEELLETAVILTEEDVEALKEFFLTPTDVIDFLKHL